MKLIILSQYFPPEMGAPSNRLLELAEGFAKEGWEIKAVTAMPNYPGGEIFDGYKDKFSLSEKIFGIEVYRYWMYASNSTNALKRIASMLSFSITSLFSLKKIRKAKPDIILTESPPLTISLTGYILSKFSGAKFVMNVSDIWPLTAKELGYIGDGLIYRQIEKLEHFLYDKADLCSGQSDEITSHIGKHKNENVYLFRNGVDVRRFDKPETVQSKDGDIKIVYAGLLGVAQGILGIIKAIDFKKAGAEFHIYGEGAEKTEIRRFINENPGRNIFLHEPVSRDEIPDVLKKYYCALIPLVRNIYGAVPSKIYEAMAAGLPVLFSGTGEGARIISENEAGLNSDPQDYSALESNIIKLKSSTELRNKLSENGRKLAVEKFDRNKLIKEFSEKLKKLIA